MSKPEYDALVDELALLLETNPQATFQMDARIALATVFKHISKPTASVVEAWEKAYPQPLASIDPFKPITQREVNIATATADLVAMLNASALTPGEE